MPEQYRYPDQGTWGTTQLGAEAQQDNGYTQLEQQIGSHNTKTIKMFDDMFAGMKNQPQWGTVSSQWQKKRMDIIKHMMTGPVGGGGE